jgi:TolB-like protein
MNKKVIIIFILFFPYIVFAQQAQKPRILVFDIKAEKGVDESSARLLTEIVMDKITNINKYEVIGQKDLDKMLFWESNKQLKNCNESSCLMAIAGAMGAEYYVEGSIGVLGEKYVFTLKLINALKAEIVRRKTIYLDKDEKSLLEKSEEIVNNIMGVESRDKKMEKDMAEEEKKERRVDAVVKEEKSEKIKVNKVVSWSLIGIGVAAIGVGIKYGLGAKNINDDEERTKQEAEDAQDDYKRAATIANISYITGGVLVAGGLVWMFLDSGNKEEKKISIQPSINQIRLSINF